MYQEFLTQADLDAIHQTSVRILANIGVNFPTEEAQTIFRRHGFKVEGRRVYLTEAQLWDALGSVPRQFTLAARNAQRNVVVGGGRAVFAPGYGAPFLVDPEVGKRVPTLEDYLCLVKLAHMLPNQDLSGFLLVEPTGVPGTAAHLRLLQAHMTLSDKVFMGSAVGRAGVEHTMAMASILFGDLKDHEPVTLGLINSLTPLGYSAEMLDALVGYATWRQPVIIAALAMAGSTAPVTLAGTLALQNAELLAGVVLTQLVNPGTPVLYGSTSTNIDMKTGALCIGSPELSQMVVAHAQLARYYHLPCRSGGALTDASYPDAQAGAESMLALLTTVDSGVDFVLHAGGILNAYLAFSYEKFVLDDELCGMVRRVRQGFPVTPETLAYDVAEKVGPGGNYLMEDHTLANCRKVFWTSSVADRSGLDGWLKSGRPDPIARARRRWQKLVADYRAPALDATIERQLAGYVEEHAG
jgi:trimethylamine---corrinoid protein Co-methyltransferase